MTKQHDSEAETPRQRRAREAREDTQPTTTFPPHGTRHRHAYEAAAVLAEAVDYLAGLLAEVDTSPTTTVVPWAQGINRSWTIEALDRATPHVRRWLRIGKGRNSGCEMLAGGMR